MPTYDYRCDACGHEFELFQRMSDSVKRKCPDCGEFKLQRLIGAGAGVIFKGSGFYETDYRSESYKQAAEAETGKSGKADAAADKKSDAKKDAPARTADATPANEGAKPGAKPGAKRSARPGAKRARRRTDG
jgi:putative FmdB family regulatory protein